MRGSTSSLLCCLHVCTAGQQGAALGSDETETVLLAYALVDPATNELVGVQEYVVRPSGSDLNANFLSEQVLAETRLTENAVKTSGLPLDKAINQFESFLRTVQIPSGGITFITDGQLPLRQALHPETSRRDIELPKHYFRFADLRKDVARVYSSAHPFTSIGDMLIFLDIPHTGDTDFYAKEVKDMINIVQRLINDGYKFTAVETVNLVLEPGICSKNEEVDSNCVVRARGLPWQSSDQDIAKFFRGLNVAKGGVALCLSSLGRRNGEALVRFVCSEHREMALKRHKHHIGQRYIEVYRASGEDFVNVAGGSNNEAQAFLTRGAQVIIRMRGLPYDCTAKQVIEFFEAGDPPCSVMDGEEGVLFVRKPDGRSTGDAFVLFKEESDSAKAIARHRELIGTRYIELFRSTTAEVQQVLNRTMENYETSPAPLIAPLPSVPLLPQHIITSGTRKDCIRLRGLPYEAQVEHILEFLGEHAKSIVFQGVHMVYNSQGQPSGEAFIQMDSEPSAYTAAQLRHHRYMTFGKKQRYIEVFQCSGEDMNLVLTGGLGGPGSSGNAGQPQAQPSQLSPVAKALLSPGIDAQNIHALPPPPPPNIPWEFLVPPPPPQVPSIPYMTTPPPVWPQELFLPSAPAPTPDKLQLVLLPKLAPPPPGLASAPAIPSPAALLGLKRSFSQAFHFPLHPLMAAAAAVHQPPPKRPTLAPPHHTFFPTYN